MTTDANEYTLNKPGYLTCPDCGGALTKIEDGPIPKYVCHIGHILTGEANGLPVMSQVVRRAIFHFQALA